MITSDPLSCFSSSFKIKFLKKCCHVLFKYASQISQNLCALEQDAVIIHSRCRRPRTVIIYGAHTRCEYLFKHLCGVCRKLWSLADHTEWSQKRTIPVLCQKVISSVCLTSLLILINSLHFYKGVTYKTNKQKKTSFASIFVTLRFCTCSVFHIIINVRESFTFINKGNIKAALPKTDGRQFGLKWLDIIH